MAAWKCSVEINGISAEFAIDEPDPYRMVHTRLVVDEIVHKRCYCMDAIIEYKGMLQWSISLDSRVVGYARVYQDDGGD